MKQKERKEKKMDEKLGKEFEALLDGVIQNYPSDIEEAAMKIYRDIEDGTLTKENVIPSFALYVVVANILFGVIVSMTSIPKVNWDLN